MDIPSLFMIPSAVSSGKVHSVFPNSTDADFDFNRDSSATRVNSQGLIEEVGYFGSELVTNGTFDNNLNNWNLAAGGQTIVWENGKVRLTTDGTFASLQQTITTVVGKVYRARVDIDVTSGSNLALNIGGTQVFGNGKRTLEMLFTATGTATQFQLKRYSGAVSGTFDNATFVEVQGDRARLNYEIEGGLVNTKPSLLLEPQSTNLVASSENLKDSYVTTNASVDLNNSISPDGTNTANKFNSTALNSKIQKTHANSSATSHTISIFLKKGSIDLVGISVVGGGPAISASTTVNLTSGTITASSGNGSITPTITRFSNDWYRVTASSTSNGSVANPTITITNQSTISNGYFYIWGLQFEGLSYATSYIPTNGSTQTRAGETCLGAGTSSILPSEEGILYAEIASLSNSGNYRLICLSDGTTSNRVFIGFRLDTGYIYYFVIVGGSTVASHITSTTSLNFSKVAVKWKANDFALWINGSEISTDTSGSSFSANTLSTINLNEGDGAGFDFYGKIRDIRVYNTKEMTDSEVDILLTKITS